MNRKTYQNPVGVGKYTGLMLVTPFIIGALLFTVYPFVSSFVLGLTDYDGIGKMRFTGAENYINMLNSYEFINSLSVTIRYTLLLVPLKLFFSLITAILLNIEIKGIGIYRTIIYIPSILGSNLAVVVMWQFLFTSDGLVNQILGLADFSPVSWYGDSKYAILIIVFLRLWEFGSAMIIFLNALREIPKEYYEAAKVDGCGHIRAFFKITLPLLRNVIFLNLVLQTIAAFQEFNAPYMLTCGGPVKSTNTIALLIYNEMFRYNNIGYANAVSWSLFMIISVSVIILFSVMKRNDD